MDHFFAAIVAGGGGVVLKITSGQVDSAQIAVLDLKTGERKILVRGGSQAEYAASGHLIYAAGGALRAVRFDLARLEVFGDPIPRVEQGVHSLFPPSHFPSSPPPTPTY